MVLSFSSCRGSRKESTGYTAAQLDSFLVISLHAKFLDRLDVGTQEARVNPVIWSHLPEDAQRTSARMFAWYCAGKSEKKNSTPNVTVINEENGETLARYNEVLGYSTE
jgi:hypothetical protein